MDDQRTSREGGGMKRFSLRDIFLLFLIIALAVGWWMDRRTGPARFEMKVNDKSVFVLDTVTGEVRSQNTGTILPPGAPAPQIIPPKIPE